MAADPKAEEYLIGSIRAAMENVRRRTNAPFGAVIARARQDRRHRRQ